MNPTALASGLYAVVRADFPAMQTPDNPLVAPMPPAFVVSDFDITPHKTMRFASELDITARLIISRADAEQGGADTRGYLGDGEGSIFYAIEKPHILGTGNQTLGGACDQAYVSRMRGYRLYRYASGDYLGAEFVIHAVGERAS